MPHYLVHYDLRRISTSLFYGVAGGLEEVDACVDTVVDDLFAVDS